MKKTFLLFMLFCIALSSCKKDNNSTQPTTYRIDNITDIQMQYYPGSSTYLSYTVNYVGPIQETVTLSLSGLPAGITVDTNAHTGIPTFGTNFIITNDGTAKAGTYTITLNCVGSKTGTKSYTFKLKVLPAPQCTSSVTGFYTQGYDCSGARFSDNVSVDPLGTPNRIYFSNFANLGVNVYADLTCLSSSLTIPRQYIGGHMYRGSGSFYPGYIYYNYYDSSAFGYNYCTITLQP